MDIPTPLCREGGLFFLPDEYFSFATDKIWERGEGEKEIHDINQIFFSEPFRFVCPGEWQVC